MYTECPYCNGMGCYYCQDESLIYPYNPDGGDGDVDGDPSFLQSPTQDLTSTASTMCDWCNGDGCDECLPASSLSSSSLKPFGSLGTVKLDSSISITARASQQAPLVLTDLQLQPSENTSYRPQFLDATSPCSININDLTQSLIYAVYHLSNQLYTTYNDAEALLRGYDWNVDRLLNDWVTDFSRVREICGATSPDDTHLRFLTSQKTFKEEYIRNNCEDTQPEQDSGAKTDQSMMTNTTNPSNAKMVYCFSGWCDPVPESEAIVLACGHAICSQCLSGVVGQGYLEGSMCTHIRCPAFTASSSSGDDAIYGTSSAGVKCPQPIPYRYIERILHSIDQESPLDEFDTGDAQSHDSSTPTDGQPTPSDSKAAPVTRAKTRKNEKTPPPEPSNTPLESQLSHPPTGPVDTRYLFSSPFIPSIDASYSTPVGSDGTSQQQTRIQFFYRWLADSYLRSFRHIRTCTNPDCSLFIFTPKMMFNSIMTQFKTGSGAGGSSQSSNLQSFDYNCPCGYFTCLLCGFSGGHHPCPCDLASTFTIQSGDRLTQELIASTTKSCPKCNVLISKDRFCNHVHCVKCGHHFCWLCKGDWSRHSQAYRCAEFLSGNASVEAQAENKTIEIRSSNFQKYNYFYNFFLTYRNNMTDLLKTHYTLKDHVTFQLIPNLTRFIQHLWSAYSILSWSYGISSYLIDNGRSGMIQVHQSLLAHNTEQVSLQFKSASADISLLLDSITYQQFHDSVNRMKSSLDQFISSIMELDIVNNTDYDAISKSNANGGSNNSNASIIKAVTSTGAAVDSKDKTTITGHPLEDDSLQTSWACGLCSCLHIVNDNSSSLFADLDIEVKHHQLKEITRKSGNDVNHNVARDLTKLEDGPCQYRGIFRNQYKMIVCANCLACQRHSEKDCRLCYPVAHNT